MEALRQVEDWPVRRVALGVTSADETIARRGDATAPMAWASVTKLATALAALVAAEEGVVDLDETTSAVEVETPETDLGDEEIESVDVERTAHDDSDENDDRVLEGESRLDERVLDG